MAVSVSGDPLGAYYRYEWLISNTKLNDYPKFGVWPDGYYMSINQFTCNIVFCSWAGQGAVVFERDSMLAGGPARGVYFDLYFVDPNLGGMLPSDLDGVTPPPAGAPNRFCQVDDDAWGYSGDQLQCWKFQTNWASPLSSTFTFDAAYPAAAFDSNMCGYSRTCIPQPGGANVDAISDRLMYRLQYRNFGTHETLVTNHTVDATGGDRAGVRWYELRNSGSGWSMFQQGTFSPDAHHRWMGSIAMNGIGDIALGYSVSSVSLYPSINATGRLDGETSGVMTQGELPIVNGSGYQAHSSGRWGDYSTMSVDPVDDCTFWYTQEYYAATTLAAGWRTRVGAFRLRDCGAVDPPPPPEPPTASHVGDLDRAATKQKSEWTAIVTTTLHDTDHVVVAGATVTGAWNGGATGTSSCTTDASGRCTVSKAGLRNRTASVTFTVTGVTHPSLTYASAGNHDPDGDSDGTTITIPKP